MLHEFAGALELHRNKEECAVKEELDYSVSRSLPLSSPPPPPPPPLRVIVPPDFSLRRSQDAGERCKQRRAMHLHICINKTDSLICMLSAFIFFI